MGGAGGGVGSLGGVASFLGFCLGNLAGFAGSSNLCFLGSSLTGFLEDFFNLTDSLIPEIQLQKCVW